MMAKKKWRIVLDTSVFIAALRSNYGAAAQILAMIFARNIINCMDLKMTYEYRDVAMRSDQLVASKRTLDDVERLVHRMEDAAEFVDPTQTTKFPPHTSPGRSAMKRRHKQRLAP